MDNADGPKTVGDLATSEYLTQFDVEGERTFTMAAVILEDISIAGTSRKETKGVIVFERGVTMAGGREVKKYIVNATGRKVIARLYGGELSNWVGESITLYRDPSVKMKGATVGGIKVRPNKPTPPKQERQAPKPKPADERVKVDGILRGFKMADTLEELKVSWVKGLTSKAALEEVRAAYTARHEQITKDQAEPEPQQEPEQDAMDFGPPRMDDIDPELFPDDPATGRVE